jgi:hypothetical protein
MHNKIRDFTKLENMILILIFSLIVFIYIFIFFNVNNKSMNLPPNLPDTNIS